MRAPLLVVATIGLAVPFGASACRGTALGNAPSIPTAEVAAVSAKGPAVGAHPSRGACAPEAARPYVAPETARMLPTPPPLETVGLAWKVFGVWEGTTSTPYSRGAMSDVWASGADVFVAGDGLFLHSEDRGRTFGTYTVPNPPFSIAGSELHDLYVLGGRTVSHSGDVAKTWSVDDAFPEDAWVRAATADGADIYAVGSHIDGRTLAWHSNDYGHAWTPSSITMPRVTFTDVAVRNPDKPDSDVFFVGYEETNLLVVLRSSDCGASFSRISPPLRSVEAERPVRICFSRGGRIVLALAHMILTSDDDGATWKKRKKFDRELLALACRGDDVLVGGRLLPLEESDDAGETFHRAIPSLVGDDLEIRKIFFTDAGDTYAVGGTTRTSPTSGVFFRRLAR